MSSIAPKKDRIDYWRSLEELSSRPGNDSLRRILAEAETAVSSTDLNRRRFLAVVAASLSAAGVGCTRFDDRGEIASRPDALEGQIPGMPRYYASTLVRYPGSVPVLATTREGRPIKLEGNPEHPASRGSLGAFGQAATLDLYDPDRRRAPLLYGKEISWGEADRQVRSQLEDNSRAGKTNVLVTGPLVSPAGRSLVKLFVAAYPQTIHRRLATFHNGETLEGRQLAFGTPSFATIRWNLADVVLALDCDFLGTQGRPGDENGFASRRRPEHPSGMNRLWCLEAGMSTTGANADHRFSLRPGLQPRFLAWLLGQLVAERTIGALASDPLVTQTVRTATQNIRFEEFGIPKPAADGLVGDLITRQGRSAIVAGPQLPAPCQVLVAALNVTLGNEGTVVVPIPTIPDNEPSTLRDWVETAEMMNRGKVGVFIALDVNPAYALPEVGCPRVLAKVPFIVASSLLRDETASLAHLALPAAHDLESWGDSDFHPDVVSLQQPVMRPLFQARQSEESLLSWLSQSERPAASYHEYVKARWKNEVHPQTGTGVEFTHFWEAALHDGFIDLKSGPVPASTLSIPEVINAISRCSQKVEPGFDLTLRPSPRVYDGRFANNGWLQELPHPVTTQSWGNSAVIGPSTALSLGCKEGQIVTVKVGGAATNIPVLVSPGVAENSVQIDLGYGRSEAGTLGSQVGVDAGKLRCATGGVSPWVYSGVRLVVTSEKGRIIRVQQHHATEGRSFLREADADSLRQDQGLEKTGHQPAQASRLTPGWHYKGEKWGMIVDLSACNGCGACTIACVAENNVPVVGPEEVGKGREMHWVRVDRYFSGPAANPSVSFQPMMCHQCDSAPCEKVCPVAATVHSPEGLDEMVYNRCVGTRYCANNCPYKVRRFNYLDYHKDLRAPVDLLFNPEVTVRSRGVMEKCTFCVQRIAAARQAARAAGRKLADGDIQTACQQACPTGAIVFGDLNDPGSRVHKLAHSGRGYQALGELGIGPAVTYLARIRNPRRGLKI
ncbi:MAG: 4Fe-4S dicluster domain-containing protein [Acidobacteria bacterium]|nr:MAG: 4Fe-4S dicluster domain-containing protein [Acidobacteriota bacterium]